MDARRRNLSTESLAANVERLKSYRARLILFPRRSGKQKPGDASVDDVKMAKEATHNRAAASPIHNPTSKEAAFSEVQHSEMGTGEERAYRRLREARSAARLVGVREKRAKAKAEEAQTAKK